MRKIKFRAWWRSQEKMDYGFNKKGLSIEKLAKSYSMPLGWCELMQFTGLHDCNGKEIYEGDIVKHRIYKPHEVTIEKIYRNMADIGKWGWHGDGEDLGYEVIGNIYETPELLKD